MNQSQTDKARYYKKSFLRLREHGWSYKAIGKMYAVSATAVRYTCLDLPTKKPARKRVQEELTDDGVPLWWKGTPAAYYECVKNVFGG